MINQFWCKIDISWSLSTINTSAWTIIRYNRFAMISDYWPLLKQKIDHFWLCSQLTWSEFLFKSSLIYTASFATCSIVLYMYSTIYLYFVTVSTIHDVYNVEQIQDRQCIKDDETPTYGITHAFISTIDLDGSFDHVIAVRWYLLL